MIESAAESDFDEIARQNIEAYAEFSTFVRPELWREMKNNLGDVSEVARRANFFVHRSESKITGTVAYCPGGKSINPIPREWASVLLLAVDPIRRNKGIARKLIETCIDFARKESVHDLGLFTSELMLAAQSLYAEYLFKKVRELVPPRHGLRFWLYRMDPLEQAER